MLRILKGLAMVWVAGGALADGGFTEGFERIDPANWSVAHYTATHPHFDTDWQAGKVVAKAGLTLHLSPTPDGPRRFAGASLRRHQPSGFGRYEVVMQPPKGAGLVTGFFTYTGPYYGTRHDEIDIEFLGKDTTRIHLATFVGGKLHNRFVDLGFDAADAPRRYAFDWSRDSVRWYVEDRLIWEETEAVPQVPGMLFANLWAADPALELWSGVPDAGASGVAKVLCVGFAPSGPAGC